MSSHLSELKRKASPERQLQTERETHELLRTISEQQARTAIKNGTNKVLHSSEPGTVQASSSLSVEALDRYIFSLGAVLELRAKFPDRTVEIELLDASTGESSSKAA